MAVLRYPPTLGPVNGLKAKNGQFNPHSAVFVGKGLVYLIKAIMNVMMISYDLMKPGQNYPGIEAAIKRIGQSWWRLMQSTWIVLTEFDEVQVRDVLKDVIDANDKLLVGRLIADAWAGFGEEDSTWLRDIWKAA
ncbi:MAG: hypothetical protein OEV94_11985 [Deltaproteobacteria bacterium]|nr:hypothetical protein [Deltaproteobacteria bacterium]